MTNALSPILVLRRSSLHRVAPPGLRCPSSSVRRPRAAAPAAPTTTPETPTVPDVDRRTHILPPYKVLLHNDNVNSMDHVVRSLLRSVPGLSRAAAVRIMLEAHFTGVALVTTCPLELAELYRDRLQSCGLTATVEAA